MVCVFVSLFPKNLSDSLTTNEPNHHKITMFVVYSIIYMFGILNSITNWNYSVFFLVTRFKYRPEH